MVLNNTHGASCVFSVDLQGIPGIGLIRAAAWKNQARGHATCVPLPSGDTSTCFDVSFLPDEHTVVLCSLHSVVINSCCSVRVRTVNSNSGPGRGEGLGGAGRRVLTIWVAKQRLLSGKFLALCCDRCWPVLCFFPKPLVLLFQALGSRNWDLTKWVGI